MDTTQATQAVEVLPATSLVTPPAKALPEIPKDATAALRSVMIEKITENAEEILTAQIELAKGIWVKEYIKDPRTGEYKMDDNGAPVTKVYVKAPSENAGQYLLNQAVGKPKENIMVDQKVNFILDI